MTFNYRARDESGEMKTGTIDALSEAKAAEALHRAGLIVLELKSESGQGFNIERYLGFLHRVPRKEIVLFSRMLATLINARIPIIQVFEILLEQTSNANLKKAVGKIMMDVRAGKSVSEAMVGFPSIFPNLYVSLVKTGEITGTMDQALLYLANQQEKDYELNSKVRGAMIYPAFIICAILVVGGLMFVFVLPSMIDVLLESGAELPFTTRILIFLTEFIQNYWPFIITGALGLGIGSQVYIRTTAGRAIWDQIKLRLPVINKVLRNIYMDRFSRNLSTLVASSIPIVTALRTVADIVGNTVYQGIILDAAEEVEIGKSISDVFAAHPEIPVIVTQMVKVGEQTGTLHEILAKLADFFDKEVSNAVGTLTALMEPIIMIILGIAVAAMVAGILLPIYNLASVQ